MLGGAAVVSPVAVQGGCGFMRLEGRDDELEESRVIVDIHLDERDKQQAVRKKPLGSGGGKSKLSIKLRSKSKKGGTMLGGAAVVSPLSVEGGCGFMRPEGRDDELEKSRVNIDMHLDERDKQQTVRKKGTHRMSTISKMTKQIMNESVLDDDAVDDVVHVATESLSMTSSATSNELSSEDNIEAGEQEVEPRAVTAETKEDDPFACHIETDGNDKDDDEDDFFVTRISQQLQGSGAKWSAFEESNAHPSFDDFDISPNSMDEWGDAGDNSDGDSFDFRPQWKDWVNESNGMDRQGTIASGTKKSETLNVNCLSSLSRDSSREISRDGMKHSSYSKSGSYSFGQDTVTRTSNSRSTYEYDDHTKEDGMQCHPSGASKEMDKDGHSRTGPTSNAHQGMVLPLSMRQTTTLSVDTGASARNAGLTSTVGLEGMLLSYMGQKTDSSANTSDATTRNAGLASTARRERVVPSFMRQTTSSFYMRPTTASFADTSPSARYASTVGLEGVLQSYTGQTTGSSANTSAATTRNTGLTSTTRRERVAPSYMRQTKASLGRKTKKGCRRDELITNTVLYQKECLRFEK